MLWIAGLGLVIVGGFLTEVSMPFGVVAVVVGVVLLILRGFGGTVGGA